jgi:diguanylate cyclase (GGDEF)-like protein
MGDQLGRLTGAMTRIRYWAVWQLPLAARILVLCVITGYSAALTGSLWELLGRSGQNPGAYLPQVVLTCVFVGAAVVSGDVSMRMAWPRTRQDRVSRDLTSAWLLPIALLLPPAYVMVAVIGPSVHLYTRVWRGQPIKRVYSVAVLGLAYGAASQVHRELLHAMTHTAMTAPRLTSAQFADSAGAVTALVVGLATYWIVNVVLINAVVRLASGTEAFRNFLKDREGLVVDVVAACLGTVAGVVWSTDPLFAVLLVPPVLLLQHQLFSGLRQAVRTDLLTDVANPQYWREVAGREVERAAASDDHAAILMIDVDHFKSVNDRYGHLAGDEVLAAVARTIAQALRPRDLVGRLGGEEFGAVLSGLNLLDAEGAAERLRTQVRDVRVRADSGEWISVTVSVGVSELSVTGGDLYRLLDAADTALYVAKAAGRDCVRVAASQPGVVIDLSVPGQRGSVEESTQLTAVEESTAHS